MQEKVAALLHRFSAKHYIFAALLAAGLAAALIGGANVSAMAAAPASEEIWVITVDGLNVAAGESEAALSQLYDSVVASYEEEDTVSTQVLNQVAFSAVTADESTQALPAEEEAVTEALAAALTVQSTRRVSETEVIPAASITVEDDTMYNDESCTEEGWDGEQVIVTDLICINGETILQRLDSITTTVEPRDTVTTVGTLERPEFIWPTHGRYTGSYGIDTINGANRKHTGIDIAASAGTDICAARAGTVVYAGWDGGGYGNLVVIQHDNGTHTYYAHNSSILVSVGDYVEQGEHIAEMGATGKVTGVHCHFEIRSGNYHGLYVSATVNPLNYLSLSDL